MIYPHLIGGDIGCGMALFKTDLVRRDVKLDRWAQLQFNLEHPWDELVSDFLAEHDLESTEFDAALGTIGGGNHFAELQAVEESPRRQRVQETRPRQAATRRAGSQRFAWIG